MDLPIFNEQENINRQQIAQMYLKSQLEQSIVVEDDNPKIYDLVKSEKPVSKVMFPMVTRAIKTGSRADQVYLEYSDIDYIYEIGPAVVANGHQANEVHKETLKNVICFKWKATNNVGFYTICDADDGYVYPGVIQAKVAPLIKLVKPMALLPKNSATLNLNEEITKKSQMDEDAVISLKCFKWPEDVWLNFSSRKPKLPLDIMDKLQDENLYFVPKSHPASDDGWVEWRLSFSLVEIKIMQSLPYVYRKVLLLCKRLVNNKKSNELHKKTKKSYIPSYILKTVFLSKCEDWYASDKSYKEENLFDMVHEVFIDIKNKCKNKWISQYFLPKMNLMDFIEPDECQILTSSAYLDSVISKFSLTESILSNKFFPFYPVLTSELDFLDNAFVCTRMCSEMFTKVYTSEEHISGRFDDVLKSYLDIDSANFRVVCLRNHNVDLVMEIYIMFLFLLRKMNEKSAVDLVTKYAKLLLYALKIFSRSMQLDFNLFAKYCKSITEYVHNMDDMNYTTEPLMSFLGRRNQSALFKIEEISDDLLERWQSGKLDEDYFHKAFQKIPLKDFEKYTSIPGIWMKKGKFQFGNQAASQEIFDQLESSFFCRHDISFKTLTADISFYLNENMHSFVRKNSDTFFSNLLVDMTEMYNYGFTNSKFCFPTPAVYLSYLKQVAINSRTQKQALTIAKSTEYRNLENDKKKDEYMLNTMKVIKLDDWGYYVRDKDGKCNYVTCNCKKNNTFIIFLDETSSSVSTPYIHFIK